jgi:uncharacterized surface protein with fasciclin (FAS1) repeats
MGIAASVCMAVFAVGATPALAEDAGATGGASTIVQIAASDPDLTTLVKALSDTGLVKTLESPGPFTVFAPTNEAFAKLPSGLLDYLLANASILKQVLLYHVAGGSGPLSADPIKTAQGEKVFPSFSLGISGLTLEVNNSRVSVTPIKASNGVIYIVDSVLIPQFR